MASVNFCRRSWRGPVSSDIRLANWVLTSAQDCSTLSRERDRPGAKTVIRSQQGTYRKCNSWGELDGFVQDTEMPEGNGFRMVNGSRLFAPVAVGSTRGPFERPEPDDAEVSRPVPEGGRGPAMIPGYPARYSQ